MKYFKLYILIFCLGLLNFNIVNATATITSRDNSQTNLDNIYTYISNRDDAMSAKMLNYSEQALQHSKDTINYFVIILGFVATIVALLGWKTLKDAEKNARTKIEEIAKKEIHKFTNSLEAKVSKIDKKVDKWREFEEAEDLKKKLEIVDQLIDADPNDFKLFGNKGIVLKKMKKYEDALVIFDKVIEINPKDPIAFYNKADCYYLLEKYHEATEYIDKAIEISPNSQSYVEFKARILLETKKFEEAILMFEKARNMEIEKSNGMCDYVSTSVNISFCYHKLKNFAKAYDVARIALNLGFSVELVVNKGLAAAGLGRRTEAEELLNMAAETKIRHDEVIYCKARMFSLLKDYDETIKYLNEAIQLDRDNKFRKMAKEEDDFNFVANSDEFRSLIQLK